MTALVRFGPPVALMGLIFFLSAQTGSDVQLAPWEIALRKLAHLTEYALLFLLWRRALPDRPAWTAAAIAIAYAVTDELHQTFVEDRTGKAYDVLLDAVGVAAGWWALRSWQGRRRPRNTKGP